MPFSGLIFALLISWVSAPLVFASQHNISGIFVEKQQDPNTNDIRAKIIITDPEKRQRLNKQLKKNTISLLLQPAIQNKQLIIQENKDSLSLTVKESLINLMIPILSKMLPEEQSTIDEYLTLFKQAPAKKVLFDLPSDFSAQNYLNHNPDIAQHAKDNNLDPHAFAMQHYADYGHTENRQYTGMLPKDFDPERYLALNPDVAAVSKNEKDPKAFAIWHYLNHPHEKRQYK
jgi:hypothetical protein